MGTTGKLGTADSRPGVLVLARAPVFVPDKRIYRVPGPTMAAVLPQRP